MVNDYFDAGQERWLEDRGIGLLRGSGRVAGRGVVEVDGVPTPPFTCCRDRRGSIRAARVPLEVLSDTIQPFPCSPLIFAATLKLLRCAASWFIERRAVDGVQMTSQPSVN